jgi:hypothetical protein
MSTDYFLKRTRLRISDFDFNGRRLNNVTDRFIFSKIAERFFEGLALGRRKDFVE